MGCYDRTATSIVSMGLAGGTSTSAIATSTFSKHWIDEANEGRFSPHILGFQLVGITTYMLMDALGRR